MGSTPYPVGSASAANVSATLVITAGTLQIGTGATGTAAGDAIVVGCSVNSASETISSVTDSRGNTYARAKGQASAGQYTDAIYVSLNSLALVSGTDTITVTYSATTATGKCAAALGCSGIATSSAVDIAVDAVNAGSTNPSVATGSLAQPNELIVAWTDNGAAGLAPTWNTPLSQVIQGFEAPSSNQWSSMGATIVSSTSPVTANTTIVSAKWVIIAISLKFAGPLITTSSLPDGTTGAAYSQTLTVSGGMSPYTWTVFSGSLPAGLSLSTAGVISGTATAAGASSFTVKVTDANSSTGTQALSIFIASTSGSSILQPPAGYALFGAYPGSGNADPDITNGFESASMADRLLAVWTRYYEVTTSWPTADDLLLMSAGRTMYVDLTPSFTIGDITWAEITAGTYDSYLTAAANIIKASGYPVLIGWDSEPDDTSREASGTAAEYIASYQHVYNLFKGVTPLAIMCWIVSEGDSYSATFYPGDAYVDWIGADPYDATLSKGSPTAAYTPFVTWLASQSFGSGKPIGIFETGVDDTVADSARAAWIDAVPAALAALGYQIWIWFNSGGTLGTTTITPGTLSASALATIGANPVFNPPSVLPSSSPYLAGSNSSAAASSTLVISVTGTTNLHDAIVVGATINSASATVTGVTDSQSNTYTSAVTNSGSAEYGNAIFVALNCAVLTAGTDTITVTFSSAAADGKTAAATGVPAAAHSGAVDIGVSATSAGSTAPSVTSGALAQTAEALIAWESNAAAGGAIHWGTGSFTQQVAGFQAPSSNQYSSMASLVVSSQASVTASGTITSAKWAILLVSLKLSTGPVIVTSSLPAAYTGVAYNQTLTVSGGVSPYTWTVSAGSLPSGMSLGSSTGVISGTATAAGASSFTVKVTDSASNTGTQALSIVVTNNLGITTSSLPVASTGVAYSFALGAAGGTAPYSFSVSAGSLPTGLSLTSGGVISGTPEVAGNTSFTAEVTDADSNTATLGLSLTVANSLTITSTELTAGTISSAYSVTLTAAGGYGADTWSILSGSLPAGLSLAGAVISGTPTATGTFSFTAEVTDAGPNTTTLGLSITINSAVVASWNASYATPYSLPAGSQPAPGALSLPVSVANLTGDWMFCVVAWRTLVATDGPPPVPTVSVGDGTNWWEPLTPASGSVTSVSGNVRASIWMAPAARAVTKVHVAPTGFVAAIAATVYDVGGMQPWISTSAVTGYANSATAISETLAAPGASAVIFTVSASDDLADTVTLGSGAGWGAVISATASNGHDHTADINCSSAFQTASGSVTAQWNSTGSLNFAAVVGAALVSAPALTSSNANWPVTYYECAPGYGLQTPPDQLTWVPLSARSLSLNATQGRQYEASQLSTGEGTLTLDNPDGALIPPGTGAFAGLTSGTPVRTRQVWQGGSWQVSFYGNGVTSGAQIDTGTIFPVTPGETYTVSAWLGCSAANATGGLTISIRWHAAGGSLISTVTSGNVTSLAATLATATGTAPGTAATAAVVIGVPDTPAATVTFYAAAAGPAPAGYLVIPAGISWTAENGATAAVLAPFTPDRHGPPGACPWFVPFSGFLERLPQNWDASYRGVTDATITDAWFGVNYNPQPILPTEILNDGPYAYWPCTEPAGATQASNIAPGNSNPLVALPSVYGASGAIQAFGQNSSALLGASQTLVVSGPFAITQGGGMWGLSSVNFGAYEGYTLTCGDGNFPDPAGGVTIEFWFQVVSPFPAAGLAADSTLLGVTSGNEVAFSISIDSPGDGATGHLYLWDGADRTAIEGSVNYQAGTPPVSHVAFAFNRSSWTAYVNGAQTAGGSWSSTLKPEFGYVLLNGLGSFLTPQIWIQPVIGGEITYGQNFNGYTGHVAIFPRILHPARILTHYQAGISAMAGEPACYRIERLLQAGNATGRRVIQQEPAPDQDFVVSCQDIPGQPASTSIANVTGDLLPGIFYISPRGEMAYLAKYNAWNNPVAWLLGDNAAAGEYAAEDDITFDYDPSRVLNQIQLTQLDDQSVSIPSVTAITEASQVQYGTISDLATGYLQGDANYPLDYGPGLPDLADWLANVYQAPQLRLSQVTVDAASQPAAWPFVLGASAGDMVTVSRRQGSASPLISVTGRITQTDRTLQYDEGGVTGSITCIIDPAPEYGALTADDPVRGLLNGENILGW